MGIFASTFDFVLHKATGATEASSVFLGYNVSLESCLDIIT